MLPMNAAYTQTFFLLICCCPKADMVPGARRAADRDFKGYVLFTAKEVEVANGGVSCRRVAIMPIFSGSEAKPSGVTQ
jgi:hypothetical protein